MAQVARAVYEKGVLRLLDHVDLQENQRVRIRLEPDAEPPSVGANTSAADPLQDIRVSTGLADLAERFDDYRFAGHGP